VLWSLQQNLQMDELDHLVSIKLGRVRINT